MNACDTSDHKRRGHEQEREWMELEVQQRDVEIMHKLNELDDYVRKRFLNDTL